MARNQGIMGIDDRSIMQRSLYPRYCMLCKHFDDPAAWSCKAFDKIPKDIWEGEADHREPYEGDGGFRFESDENVAEKAMEMAFDELDDMKEG